MYKHLILLSKFQYVRFVFAAMFLCYMSPNQKFYFFFSKEFYLFFPDACFWLIRLTSKKSLGSLLMLNWWPQISHWLQLAIPSQRSIHERWIRPMVPLHLHGEMSSSLLSPSWQIRQILPSLNELENHNTEGRGYQQRKESIFTGEILSRSVVWRVDYRYWRINFYCRNNQKMNSHLMLKLGKCLLPGLHLFLDGDNWRSSETLVSGNDSSRPASSSGSSLRPTFSLCNSIRPHEHWLNGANVFQYRILNVRMADKQSKPYLLFPNFFILSNKRKLSIDRKDRGEESLNWERRHFHLSIYATRKKSNNRPMFKMVQQASRRA